MTRLTLPLRWLLPAVAMAALLEVRVTGQQPPAADADRSARLPGEFAPRSERAEWEIVFPDAIGIDEYARQLDHFEIEIAAISRSGRVDYISQVSRPKPERRGGERSADSRLYIGWKQGELVAADRKLLTKAGVSGRGKEIQHYFPARTQALMAEVEKKHAGGDISRVRRTRFQIRPDADGDSYKFVVVEQDPPGPDEARPAKSP